jgi:hypothetical protein
MKRSGCLLSIENGRFVSEETQLNTKDTKGKLFCLLTFVSFVFEFFFELKCAYNVASEKLFISCKSDSAN